MKRLLLALLFLLTLSTISYCQTAKEKLNDTMGHAYKAAAERKIDEAKGLFRKAIPLAKEVNSWQALLDSGYGLSTLGLPEEAKSAFDSASAIVLKAHDWRGAIGLGYAYASLPKETKNTDSAIKMWLTGKQWADENGEWPGLIEAGRGFMSISKNKEAEECFDMAKEIVEGVPTEQAIKALVQAYRKLGKEDKALECTKIQAKQQASSDLPPPGWVPTAGETVRGPKTVAPEVQQAQRMSADRDIETKQQFDAGEEQAKYEEKMQRQEMAYQAYRDSLMYYSYPYYGSYSGLITNSDDYYMYSWSTQPVWCARTNDEIYNWGVWNLGRYSCVNGFYIEVNID